MRHTKKGIDLKVAHNTWCWPSWRGLHRFQGLVKCKSDVDVYAPLYGRKPQSRASVLCQVPKNIYAGREGKATYKEKVSHAQQE